LQQVLKSVLDDTSRVNTLIELSRIIRTEKPEEAVRYGKEAVELAEKLNYTRGLAQAYKWTGVGYFIQASYLEAMPYYELSLAMFDSIGDKNGKASMLGNIGNIWYNQGVQDKAIDFYLKSLKLAEEINDSDRVITMLINIGAVYTDKKSTYDKALEYLRRAYPLSVAIGNTDLVGTTTVNIGEIFFKKYEIDKEENKRSDLDSALYYFKKSIVAYQGTENLPYALNYIGRAYLAQGDFSRAVEFQQQAYAKSTELGARNDMMISLLRLAQTYFEKKDIPKALASFKEAEAIAAETDATKEQKEIYEGISAVYAELADYKNAYKYQAMLIKIKDLLYDIDSDKKLGTLQFSYDLDKKESKIKLLTKDQELKDQEISRQKFVRNSFMGGFAVVLLFAGIFFSQRNRISKEKKRSDELLLNILPEETAEELKSTGTAKAKSFNSVSVLFTDFKNFTQASEKLTPEELVQEINHCYSEFDKIITRHGIEKIKTIGDAYMCAGGLPVENLTHPADVVEAGLEMVEFIEKNKQERIANGLPFFELRCGIHTGPVVAGIVGIKKFAYDIWGDTVNTASRMESSGEIGKVNISGTTYEIIKDKFKCEYRGKVKAKNKGEIDMYFVDGKITNA
ncbi:MAG TPA: adenylate/guanylate cyclase domain-containing protein, partial [Bacteroidia bacterium]|nr:adenylate/guanylate cyclase domain-containing protein [Bacteroidia bacterium]